MSRLFVCGDIYNSMSEMKKSFISDELVEVIKSVDYSVCNLEGVEVDHNTTHVDYPHQQFGTVSYLKSCGFNMCLLANNHITDGGPDRLNYTIDAIDNVRLDYIGAGFTEEQVYAARIKQIGNYKFGIINLCEAQEGQFSNSTCKYGYAWIGHFSIAKTISELRTKVDFILCFCHYGLEHYEVPLDCVRQYYYLLIDQGVDCIVGTHPHIAQGYEYYNDKLIVYSLGNFFFPRRTGRYDDENHSYSVVLEFEKGRKVQVTPIFHKLEEGAVCTDNSGRIDLKALNLLLSNNYKYNEEETIRKAFDGVVGNLFYNSMCSMSDQRRSPKERLKDIFRYTMFRSKYINSTAKIRASIISRLFKNEIYRYIIIKIHNDYGEE